MKTCDQKVGESVRAFFRKIKFWIFNFFLIFFKKPLASYKFGVMYVVVQSLDPLLFKYKTLDIFGISRQKPANTIPDHKKVVVEIKEKVSL